MSRKIGKHKVKFLKDAFRFLNAYPQNIKTLDNFYKLAKGKLQKCFKKIDKKQYQIDWDCLCDFAKRKKRTDLYQKFKQKKGKTIE